MIPKDYLEKGLTIAKDSYFFGMKLSDMERDELIACAAMGW